MEQVGKTSVVYQVCESNVIRYPVNAYSPPGLSRLLNLSGKRPLPFSSALLNLMLKSLYSSSSGILVSRSTSLMNFRPGTYLSPKDRATADDLLGCINVPLKTLMTDKDSLNHMSVRNDGLLSDSGKEEPGTLHWEVGYFAKTTFDQHLEHKRQDAKEVREKIEQEAEAKLREAKARDETAEDAEVEQQKKEDLKEKSDEVIAGSKPTEQWPSGILSVRIEQISGLEVDKIRESGVKEDAEEDDEADLPSAYCTIMINHQRVYKTRTKMKSNNPFVSYLWCMRLHILLIRLSSSTLAPRSS